MSYIIIKNRTNPTSNQLYHYFRDIACKNHQPKSMNNLALTAKILTAPIYKGHAGTSQIRMTVKHIDMKTAPMKALIIDCEWDSPPSQWFVPDSLKIDDLIWIQGYLFQGFITENEKDLRNRPLVFKITQCSIVLTRSDYSALKLKFDAQNRKNPHAE